MLKLEKATPEQRLLAELRIYRKRKIIGDLPHRIEMALMGVWGNPKKYPEDHKIWQKEVANWRYSIADFLHNRLRKHELKWLIKRHKTIDFQKRHISPPAT